MRNLGGGEGDTNKLIYNPETDSQTWRMNLELPEEKRVGGQIVRSLGLICTFKMDNQQGTKV